MSSPATVLLLLKRLDCNDGVSAYCRTVMHGVKAYGDRIVIVSGPVTTEHGSEAKYNEIKNGVVDWVVLPRLGSPATMLADLKAIAGVVKRHKVDVISPQGFSTLPLGRLAASLLRLPLVLNYHPSLAGSWGDTAGAQARERKRQRQYRLLSRLTFPDRYIAGSREIEDFFVEGCGAAREKIAYVSTGIDTSFFRLPSEEERLAARRRYGLPEGRLAYTLVGRLNFVKGHDVMVKAGRLLRASHPELDFEILFGGGGDQEAEIRRFTFEDEADARTFRFLGYGTDEDVRELFWASDVIVLPSRSEGFGLVIAEAMACGCVPIRTRTGGTADQIIEGVTGYAIDIDDAPALAERMAALRDPALRATLRANAARHATAAFARTEVMRRTSEVFRAVARRGD